MKSYKCLINQEVKSSNYLITPIRDDDKYLIMKWRNEQMYHLRQQKPLTQEIQQEYFKYVITKLFDQHQPSQILFSYLERDKCIGYGGLVHIDWINKNAEISFIMDTSLEKNYFEFHWKMFLFLVEEIAFRELGFHKIFTYAFDLRKHLYPVLESAGYEREAILKGHCFFELKFIDVFIHSKWNPE